jgi:hypothetical protein
MNIELDDFILVADNFLSEEECANFIKIFNNLDAAGFGSTRARNNLEIADTQVWLSDSMGVSLTSTVHARSFIENFWHNIYPIYLNKFGIFKSFDQHYIRELKIQKTNPEEGYHVWHCENGSHESMRRLLAYIVYLNDVEEGGETEFLYYRKRVKAKRGRIVLWPAGFTHTHRGNPPLSGEKYVATGWVEL